MDRERSGLLHRGGLDLQRLRPGRHGKHLAHAKAHMKTGEGSGHHGEVSREITEYNTVSNKEEGYWETKVIGGHWKWASFKFGG